MHESTVSHMFNEEIRSVSVPLVDRFESLVAAHEATRIDALRLEVWAFCDSHGQIADPKRREETVTAVRGGLKNPNSPLLLPEGVAGALLRVGDERSRLFLIALAPSSDENELRALAHELQHLQDMLLSSIKPPRAPRGCY